MTYMHVNEFAKEFKVTCDWLLEEAEAEFEKGDFVQASEKSWGAVAQYLKAIATERDWGHDTHSHLVQIAERLEEESNSAEMAALFNAAESLHANYYQVHRTESGVRRRMDDVRQYVEILRAIPLPEVPPRRNHVKARPFYRTRDGNP